MNEEKSKEVKTLQANIVKKVLSKKQYKTFLKEYKKHSHIHSVSRNLGNPVTPLQKESLRLYLFGEASWGSRQALAKKRGVSPAVIHGNAGRAATMILFQYKDKLNELNLKKLLGGEEVEK